MASSCLMLLQQSSLRSLVMGVQQEGSFPVFLGGQGDPPHKRETAIAPSYLARREWKNPCKLNEQREIPL